MKLLTRCFRSQSIPLDSLTMSPTSGANLRHIIFFLRRIINKKFDSWPAIVTRIFGKAADPLTQWLMNYINVQHDLLVLGKFNGTLPSSVVKRNGIAYLEGWDTWAQLMPVVGLGTQPRTFSGVF